MKDKPSELEKLKLHYEYHEQYRSIRAVLRKILKKKGGKRG